MDLQVYAQDRFIVNWADIEYIEIIFLKLHGEWSILVHFLWFWDIFWYP